MKKQMIITKGFLRIALVLSVSGFCTISQAAIVVQLKVSPNQDKLLVETRGTCVSGQNENGCVHVTGKNQINFNLVGDKNCATAPGAKWALDSVVLSNSKGSAPGISQVASADFGADVNTGIVTAPVSKNPNHIGIRDNNTQKYDIWYTVVAKCAGSGSGIKIDPRIENDGSGRN